ncbi:hypothetical protein GCM10007276_24010 [Agaricicola taiwanensis]|uniref:DUF2842 domain-containing protein n=2 Tax=Agaricicola taiwanensis TaxID=591372 RepID=A0A8J2YIR3_9RHOB|nr:hypothetical protein GCM10007276_24010 [Agaricicola taiwanensis]
MILLVTIVIVWALFFMALAQGRIKDAARMWQLIYYVVAGMGWVLPAMVVIRWMEKKPDDAE